MVGKSQDLIYKKKGEKFMGFKKAVRENIWSKLLLIAPSGGGKSYSAQLVMKGMVEAHNKKTGENARVAMIGTESSRDKYYANEFDYDLLQISAPFEPEKYAKAIQEAIDAGYKFLMIDSITHEWEGTGGCLEIHSKISGNSYVAWGKVTPRHNKFLDAMIESPIHVVATVRGKDKYVLEENSGKKVPKKVALGYSQRDGIEYLFTSSFVLDKDSHVAESVKDNTHIFENRNDVLTEKHGERVYEWATSGDLDSKADVLEKSKEKGKEIMEESEKKESGKEPTLSDMKAIVLELCKVKAGEGKKDQVSEIVKAACGSANPNNLKDIASAKKVKLELEKL